MSKQQRCCKICRLPGHNKRTCPQANGNGHPAWNLRKTPVPIKAAKPAKPKIKRPPATQVEAVILEPDFELGAAVPETWGKAESIVELDKASVEFATQSALFLKSFNGRNVDICSIKRLQHPVKQMQYQLERQSMAMRDQCAVEAVVEKTLFHGTSADAVESINKHGFNRSYGSVQAYGNGVYFARDATLSADTKFAKPDKNGHQMVYITKVLTGHSTLGVQGMKFPPVRKSGILFDSMVNDTINPTIYVSGHSDNQMYAEYLVEFKQEKIPAKPTPLGTVRITNSLDVLISIWHVGNYYPRHGLFTGPRWMTTLGPGMHTSITCYGPYGTMFHAVQGTPGTATFYQKDKIIDKPIVLKSKHGKFLSVAYIDNKLIQIS